MKQRLLRPLVVTALSLAMTGQACALDWYRWRGPDLNGVSKETGWLAKWPAAGPKPLWKASVGMGFAGVSVSQGRAFTTGNQDDKDTVYCLDAETGNEVWKYSYDEELAPKYYDGGTSASPTVDGDRVYTLSKSGRLFCFEAASGKVVWQKDLAADTGAKQPEWGFASSPVVQGDLLILNVGSAGTAVEKATGRVVWFSGEGPAGYSSAVPFERAGENYVALFVARAVVAVRIKDGKELWRHPWKTQYDVNAADPIMAGDRVFVSSGYNRGCALINVAGAEPSVAWEGKAMRNHFNPCVLIGNFLYGIDGDAASDKNELKCINLETGAEKWAEKTGFGGLVAADGKLIVMNHRGKLSIIEASSNGCRTLATAQVLGGKCWTAPTLSNGRIYCRSAQGDLVCLDVREK